MDSGLAPSGAPRNDGARWNFSRHCEGTQRRSNPAFLLRQSKLDCFASLAMTVRESALLRRLRLRQRRIVRVPLGAAAVERRLVEVVQRRALLQALDEVGVG